MYLNFRLAKNKTKGVSTFEYLLIFVAIVVAMLFMYKFVRQYLSSRYKDAGDAFGGGRQYEPYGEHKTTITIK